MLRKVTILLFAFLLFLAVDGPYAQNPPRPGNLAIYYGFPSSVNGATDIDTAVETFSAYDVVIFADTLQLPQHDPDDSNSVPDYDGACTQNSHWDHDNTVQIIQALTAAGTEVYGYISLGGENTARICDSTSPQPTPLTMAEMKDFVNLWEDMGVTGIFLDEAGYDFGTDRARQNDIIRYVHCVGGSGSEQCSTRGALMPVFINAFLQEEIFEPTVVGNITYGGGNLIDQDSSYEMNPMGLATELGPKDLSLLESFQIIRGTFVYPPDWKDLSDKALRYQRQHGTQFATVTTGVEETQQDCGFDRNQFDYAWWSTFLYGFSYMGWGEGFYFSASGACNGHLPFHARPNPSGIGSDLTSPQVAHALNIHTRQTTMGRIEVDTNSHTGQFVAGTPVPPSGSPLPPVAELNHWWPADGSATDIIGYSHGRLALGKSWFAPGQVGQAFSLDGRDDFISVGSGASVTGTGPFSIDAWIRTTDDSGVIIQQRSSSEYNGQYVLSVGGRFAPATDPGKVCWSTYGDDAFGFNFCSDSAVNDGAWHHVAGVRETSGAGHIYIDGVLDRTEHASPRELVPIEVFIGADTRDNLSFFDGLIDEVAIVNRALTETEIQMLAAANSVGRARPASHGVWVFSDEVSNLSDRETIIQRTTDSGVTDLYLSVFQSTPNTAGRQMYEDEDLADLVTRAHNNGIQVWAAYGAPDWPALGCDPTAFPLARMAEMVAYNLDNPTATFDGVMLDVEPPEPQTESERQQLLDLYECIIDALKPNAMGTQAAIRFFWDDQTDYPASSFVSQKLYEHIVDAEFHRVVVMGYRDFAGTGTTCADDDGIICLDKDEIGYADTQGKIGLMLVGAETNNCVPDCPETVTFFEETQTALNRNAACVANHFSPNPSFGGFAIHRYKGTYLSGMTGWPETDITFPGVCGVGLSTVSYTNSANDVFPNPDRGFLYSREVFSWGEIVPPDRIVSGGHPTQVELQQTFLGYRDESITLVKLYFYLDDFVPDYYGDPTEPDYTLPDNYPLYDADAVDPVDIGTEYLAIMQNNFDALRGAGLKAVVRFAYTNKRFVPPFQDADLDQVLAHLDQLAPILQDNRDVIALVEAGFIGNWGEWFYTDHFTENPLDYLEVITEPDYGKRGLVVEAILDVLPLHMVQLRTPHYKYQIYDYWPEQPRSDYLPTPVDASSAFNGNDVARTGHHNDCFLGSNTDAGTYGVWLTILEDQDYLAAETQYVPMGGEVCNPGTGETRFDCDPALMELEQFHWSYLNVETGAGSNETYDKWVADDCLEEIQRRLGYRFRLVQGTYSDETALDDTFTISIQLKNDGWAAPFNPRPVNLVLRNRATGVTYPPLPLNEDPRFWLAGDTQTLDHTLPVPADVPPGDYDLLLHLPDAEPSLSDKPEYAIRFANDNVWEANTGYNDLAHILHVRSGPITSNVMADPNPVEVDGPITLTANVDDATTGGSNINSAEYSINGAAFVLMDAVDGAFDGVSENVTADLDPFDAADVIEICVRGTDASGNVGNEACIFLAIYDPDGGFVTGGGWINSPLGAYPADPLLTGKANFGFVAKYKKGQSTPSGQTQFRFKAGDLNFHSNSYDWLVITGMPKAMYKGTGTINGGGNYGFLLNAIDAQKTQNPNDVDTFRIKIWDKDGGDVVAYDNEMDTSDNEDPTTSLGGGNIKIRKTR